MIKIILKGTVRPISNLMLASADSQVNSNFSHALYFKLACSISLLTCLMTHTRVLKILVSLLMCTQAGITNTLEFTHEFYAFTILPEVNILQEWLSLL